MSNVGQAALTIAGFAVGAYFGNPQLGFIAGSLLGNSVFPTKLPGASGPRLQDTRTTTAVLGGPIMEVFGTDAVPGTVMWMQPGPREVSSTEEVGGKGGPTQDVTSYSYFQSIAIGICRGPMGGLRRIWENGKLVFDARPQLTTESDAQYAARISAAATYAEGFTLYLGTETQMPDPSIELDKGVGNVPAFRGLCYIVYHDRQLRDDQALRHPNFKFEISEDFIGIPCSLEFSPGVLYDWVNASDVRNSGNRHLYINVTGEVADLPDSSYSLEDFIVPWAAYKGVRYDQILTYSYDSNTRKAFGGPSITAWDGNLVTLYMHRELADIVVSDADVAAAGGLCSSPLALSSPGTLIYSESLDLSLILPIPGTTNSPIPNPPFDNWDAAARCTDGWWYQYSEQFTIDVSRRPGSPVDDDPEHPWILEEDVHLFRVLQSFSTNLGPGGTDRKPVGPCVPLGSALFDDEAYWTAAYDAAVDDGLMTAGYTYGNEYPVEQNWNYHRGGTPTYLTSNDVGDPASAPPVDDLGDWIRDESGSWRVMRVGTPGVLPRNPAIRQGMLEYNQPAFWTAAYAEAVADGLMPAGLTYGVDYPGNTDHGYARVLCDGSAGGGDATPGSLSEVVTRICGRCDLLPADLDVEDLEDDEIVGYTVTRVMSGRDALEPLRNVGFFDVIESGDVIKFRKRGSAIDRTVTAAQIGAMEPGASSGAPAVKIRTLDDTVLPRIIRLHYKAPSRDYEDGEQISPARSTTRAVNDMDIEVAVALEDDAAAKMAAVLWSELWEGRTTYEISTDSYHADLEPGDVVELPVEGFTERARIIDTEETIPLLRRISLARDFALGYVSQAVSDPPARTPGEMLVLGPSELLLLDLPPLREEDDDIGVYATVRPIGGGTWRPATVYRSLDGGTTFTSLLSVGSEPTTIEVLEPLTEGDTGTWDDSQVLRVRLITGTLENRTEADVMAGANALAIGTDGRWEIVQFTTVEQTDTDEYELSHLLRGRRGTEHLMGTGEADDVGVLVSGNGIMRLPVDLADLGVERAYKTVTTGTSYASGTDLDFASNGVARKPFSPINIEYGEVGSPSATLLTWERRDRLGEELSGGPLPMSEAEQLYEIELEQDGVIIDTRSSSTESSTIGGLNFAYQTSIMLQSLIVQGSTGYAINSTASIRRFDLLTGTLTGGMGMGGQVTGFVEAGGFLFVSVINGASPAQIYRIDPADVTLGAILDFTHNVAGSAGEFQGLATDGTHLYYSAAYSYDLKKASITDLSTVDTLAAAGTGPLSLSGTTVFVCDRISNEIVVVDTATMTETARFSCVTFPAAIQATPTRVFVQGSTQLGIYDHAGAPISVETITGGQTNYPELQHFTYDGDHVLFVPIGGTSSPGDVRFYDAASGALDFTRTLTGAFEAGGYDEGWYLFPTGQYNDPLAKAVAYKAELAGEITVRVYQISAEVGRGTPGETTITI